MYKGFNLYGCQSPSRSGICNSCCLLSAIQTLDRLELEEAFIELLHQKALDRQMFYGIMKDHGIDADIQFQFSTEGQIS